MAPCYSSPRKHTHPKWSGPIQHFGLLEAIPPPLPAVCANPGDGLGGIWKGIPDLQSPSMVWREPCGLTWLPDVANGKHLLGQGNRRNSSCVVHRSEGGTRDGAKATPTQQRGRPLTDSTGLGEQRWGGAALLESYSVVPGELSLLCCHLPGPPERVLSTWPTFPDFLSQPPDFWLFLKLPKYSNLRTFASAVLSAKETSPCSAGLQLRCQW